MKGRSVIEIMVLVFTFVVAFSITGLSAMILFVELRNPEADTALVANTVMSLVSGILGALLGLIAGKSSATGQPADLGKRPDEPKREKKELPP
jgi:cytochrome bd-type quinol oxidase subunit 1